MVKGVELPANILVLIAVGVLVLLGLIMLASAGMLGANPLTEYIEVGAACSQLRSSKDGCSGSLASVLIKLDVNGNGNIGAGDTLAVYCSNKGFSDGNCKAKVCGCGGFEVPLIEASSWVCESRHGEHELDWFSNIGTEILDERIDAQKAGCSKTFVCVRCPQSDTTCDSDFYRCRDEQWNNDNGKTCTCS